MINPPVSTNNGYAPGSLITPGPDKALQPAQPIGAPIMIEWPAYPAASAPLIKRIGAVVGEWLAIRSSGGAWSIARTPDAPRGWDERHVLGAVDGNRFCVRVPGLFVLEHDVGGYIRRVEVAAVATEWLVALDCDDAAAARRRLRALVNDSRVTANTIMAAFESPFLGGPTFATLLGDPTAPFNARNFGA